MTIIEKIKALLAKAASTDSQHEAEVFFAKAHELLEKHQLNVEDLERDDPVDGERYYEKGSTKASPDWDTMLVFAVAKYFGCKACRCYTSDGKKWSMDLVGRESARITAKEMHAYLVKTVRRLGREAVGTPGFALVDRWGDVIGHMNADQCTRRIGNALRSRLNALAASEHKPEPTTASGKNALITLDRVAAVYQERHPDSAPIGGTYYTNSGARKIAEGIGLNLQTGAAAGQRRLK